MLIVYLLLAVAVIAVDQMVKLWTVANTALGEVHSFIPNVLSLTYIQNTGAAMGILEGKMWIFYIITVVAVVGCLYALWRFRKGSKLLGFGIGLILAGAIGNFIDRVRLGYVVDMFKTDFVDFWIFNIADAALTIGVVLILIYLFLDERKDKQHGTN
ncbi:signal peptidase II [Enterococcus sp. LJL120]